MRGGQMLKPRYHSYLIRFWQEGDKGKTNWRFVLVGLIEGKQWGFASLEELLAFLRDRVDALESGDSIIQSESLDSE